MEELTMKPYKWKKGDGITTICLIIGAILGIIAGTFLPSPEEIFYHFLPYIIAGIILISPLLYFIFGYLTK